MRAAVAVLILALGATGCAGWQDMGHESEGPHLRPCTECYYENTTDSYQSLFMPDGRVIPVLAHTRVDLDELGIRNYTVHEPK